MPLFQKSVLTKHLNELDKAAVATAYTAFKAHFHNAAKQQNIRDAKEEQYQEGFLRDLFVDVFGYTLNPNTDYNLTTEYKNEKGAKKADGAVLKDGGALAVIELKGTDTVDLDHIETQAFGYKNNQKGCRYVVTSNFEKLRFYIDDSVDSIEWNLFTLTADDFAVLYLCLYKDNLLKNVPLAVKTASVNQEQSITKKLYKDYSTFKRQLYQNIVELNPQFDKIELYRKTQKLLDRFLFLLFAEDKQLLPPNSIREILSTWDKLNEMDEYVPLYSRYRKFFGYMNTGHKDNKHDIFAYNGGLFAPDEILDNISVDDQLLYASTHALSQYDFETEVDVNILGHIFEHSLNDIDAVTAESEGRELEKDKTRRKKDGVFYTPKYITKYIVENTVGKLCDEKKAELDIKDEDYADVKRKKYQRSDPRKPLNAKLEAYRNWLLQLTILDPACGSGAFLNQALEFLIAEHRKVDELRAKLFEDTIVLTDIENHILENNLYGVDLNDESIEIAKLSLWLRTAKRGRKLSSLNNNIKCGNSLIDDAEVAGEKAFKWEEEFSDVFVNGGFDVIIGNPPYGIFIDKSIQAHYENSFPLTSYKLNLYILFIERMLQVFNSGIVHFIIPKSLLFNSYYSNIRKYLINNTEINQVVSIAEKVFEDAEVGGSLLLQFTIKNKINIDNITYLCNAKKIDDFLSGIGLTETRLPQSHFLSVPNNEISIVSADKQDVIAKLLSFKTISAYYKLRNGLNPGNIKSILISTTPMNSNYKPIIWGKNISKYVVVWSGDYINYDNTIIDRISIDDIQSKKGMNKQDRIDFALRTPDLFEVEKLIIRKTGDSLIAALDDKRYYFDTLVHGIYQLDKKHSLYYLLAILNSKPGTLFYRLLHDIKGKAFAKISLDNLGSFPIPEANKSSVDLLAKYAEKISIDIQHLNTLDFQFLTLLQSDFNLPKLSNKLQQWYLLEFKEFINELTKVKVQITLQEKEQWLIYFRDKKAKALALKNEIDRTDKEIDRMVYELYELTEEEIAIVEGA